ncbi:hypothetical protein PGIGA_G00198310 [Pangasianodon gigas]|uniref:Uncharacterized protein n=1 Tax=Pangasianodon gigas TaxID=30993 RepID=A0ACC5WD45_PANGG|nr:hypothetical protein [Pangasianodon gigas]
MEEDEELEKMMLSLSPPKCPTQQILPQPPSRPHAVCHPHTPPPPVPSTSSQCKSPASLPRVPPPAVQSVPAAPLPAAQSVPAPVPSTQTGVPVSSDMQDISRWNCSCHQKIWMKTEMEALGLWPGSRPVRQPMNMVSLWRYPPQPELVETNTGLPSPKYFQLHPFFIWKPEHSIMQRLRNNYIVPCLYSCPNPQVVSSGVGRPRVILGTSGQYYILSSRLCCKACKKYWFADKPQWLDMLPKRFCNILPAFLTHKKAICKTVMDELRRSAPLPAAQSVPAPVPSTQTGVPVSSDMQDISRWNCSCHQKIWMKTEMEALGLWPGSRLVRQPMNMVSLWRYPPQPELVETNTGLPSPKYFQLHPFFIWKPEHSIMQRLRNNYILPCLYSCPNPQVVSSGVGRPRVILGTSGQYYILSSRLCCKACKKYWFADKPQWLDMLPKRFCNVLPAFLTHKKAICKTVMDELRRSGKSPNDMANQLSEVLHLKYERAHLAYLLSMQNIRDAEAGL